MNFRYLLSSLFLVGVYVGFYIAVYLIAIFFND